MQTCVSRHPARRWSVLALVALLGLAMTFATTSASNASDGHAVAAKKKCKKKGKKSAAAAKKKKCKKKKAQPQPVVLPSPAPLVRATVTWSNETPAPDDIDLHAFDSSGNHAGYEGAAGVVDHIANTSHSADAQDGGTESFTDNIFVLGGPDNREFAYALCFYTDTTATFTGVTKTGQSETAPVTGFTNSQINITIPGGPPVPDTFECG
jgi:hypothetical protein